MTDYLYLVEAGNELLHDKYDVFSSFVVCCPSEKDARRTHPSGGRDIPFDETRKCWVQPSGNLTGSDKRNACGWVLGKDIDKLLVTLLGTAVEGTEDNVVCTSFHAG